VRGRWTTLAAAVLGVPLILGSVSSGVHAAADTHPACPDGTGRLTAADLQGKSFDVQECGLRGRVVTNGTVSVTVPAPGRSLIATAETTRGSTSLVVAVSRSGAVRVSQSTVATPPASSRAAQRSADAAARSTATDPDCTDHALPPIFGFRDKLPDPFYLGPVSGVSVGDAEATLRSVVNQYNSLVNPCGVPDQSTIDLVYAGRTQAVAQVTTDLRCTQPDGQQTVAFQVLNGVLATTCTAMNGTAITDWDVALNSQSPWWTSGSCPSGAFELKSNLAHEFGHVVGLDHYSKDHRNLLMYGGLASCEQRSQLGWGEATILNSMY
jgi:hypothetical protein